MFNKNMAFDVSLVIVSVLFVSVLIGSLWLYTGHKAGEPMVQHQHWSYVVQPTTIQAWMTFDYLNRVFKLPPTYLQQVLSIQSPQYPEVSIRQFAEEENVALPLALIQVQQALTAHAATSTP